MDDIKYTKAIVRMPSNNIDKIEERNPYLNKPDYILALREFKRYIEALEYAGVDVIKFTRLNASKYACNVNDLCTIIPNKAVICFNIEGREKETNDIKKALSNEFNSDCIVDVKKGKIRGSDVLLVDNIFFVGKTVHTNNKGIKEFSNIVSKFNKNVIKIDLYDFLSINSCLCYLENNILLIAEKISNKKEFQGFKRIVVPEEEEYALSSIWVNGIVIVPLGCPRTAVAIRKLGLRVIELNLSEFKKINMSPCSLSIKF